MKHTETLTLLAGQASNTLKMIETSAGDIYYRITIRGNDNGKICYSGIIEFTSEQLARDYFQTNILRKVGVK